ncbi:MAG TPA: ABC transporter ATP-binding protein [Caulobacteraceae bacterium]|nr:ABC transporter ATP-binding protein [Caulobacteraceae bacterium]
MAPIISVEGISKTYASGVKALEKIDLSIDKGEIFALLGPNGAGKTTLINIVCGIVRASTGRILADGFDTVRQYKAARSRIGLVPQELFTDAFESVWATCRFSRGLFGRPPDPALLEKVLRDLALWDKRSSRIMELSGGMKRRVMIAKALSHEPSILFLDEPTAGVDVELRRGMWEMVRALRERGVTIILTTHYIEEAEEMADRIAVMNHGRILVVEDKAALMRKMGRKELRLTLHRPLHSIPPALAAWPLELAEGGAELVFTFDSEVDRERIAPLLRALTDSGVDFRDLQTRESSLEEIFVGLVKGGASGGKGSSPAPRG